MICGKSHASREIFTEDIESNCKIEEEILSKETGKKVFIISYNTNEKRIKVIKEILKRNLKKDPA